MKKLYFIVAAIILFFVAVTVAFLRINQNYS